LSTYQFWELLWHNPIIKTQPNSYHGYRYPAEIISHAVWLYQRFTLSFRDIDDLFAERGIIVSYETVRQSCPKFSLK